MPVLALENVIQKYAWGSHEHIARLQGRPTPTEAPEAEVWMGAHPTAPSRVDGRPLDALIAESPADLLGQAVAARFHGELPFLLKFLAAAQPLSIQAHPSLAQARVGFARENSAGIPQDAPERNYRDANHKPEILCALSEFWGLNGFRPIPELLALLQEARLDEVVAERAALAREPSPLGLARFFETLMTLPDARRERLLAQLADAARALRGRRPEYRWVHRIAHLHPGEVGVVCVLLLNLVALRPGEAMYSAAGNLHAYLEGFGIELMANSDNVLRGGLTTKHVDVPELMRTLTFRAGPATIVHPEDGRYLTPAREFELTALHLRGALVGHSATTFEILASAGGEATIRTTKGPMTLPAGGAVAVTAGTDYQLAGEALVYRASVPRGGAP